MTKDKTSAERQKRWRSKRKKAGKVQLNIYVQRKTRAMLKQEAGVQQCSISEVAEPLLLRGLLGDVFAEVEPKNGKNVTNNAVTNNEKKPSAPRKERPENTAGRSGESVPGAVSLRVPNFKDFTIGTRPEARPSSPDQIKKGDIVCYYAKNKTGPHVLKVIKNTSKGIDGRVLVSNTHKPVRRVPRSLALTWSRPDDGSRWYNKALALEQMSIDDIATDKNSREPKKNPRKPKKEPRQ